MADFNIDDELAALEKEVENEKKVESKNQGNSQNNFGNNNMNFGNNGTKNQSKKINYNQYGDNSDGLMDFLSGIDFSGNYNNNNQQNNNFNNNNNNFNNNNYNQYGNNNNNFNDYYNNRNTNYNNNNNNFNNYYNNRNTNYNYNNNYNNNNNNRNSYNKNNNYNNNYSNNNNNNNYNNNYNNYNNNNNNYNNNYNNYNNNYNNYNNNYNNYNNSNSNNYNNDNRNMNNNNQKNNMNSNRQTQNSNPSQSKQSSQSNNQNRAQNQQQKQPQQQYQQKSQQSQNSQQQKQSQSKVNQSKSDDPSEDIYPEKQEGMYHKIKEMKSLTVLEEEIALCDKIIAFKKKKGLDYDEWETKKELAEMQLENTKTMIENGSMDFEAYKKMIIGELAYEKKILKFTEMDKKSKPYELKEIIRRINQRIDVIGKELTQNPEEDNGEEEEKPEQKNEPGNTQKIPSQMPNKSQVKPQQNQTQIIDKKNQEPKDNIPADNSNDYKTQIKQPQSQHYHHHQGQQPQNNKIPSQYIIQKKELITDPKTGKQKYVMKNVVDPKYAQMLKQKQNEQQAQNQHHHQPQAQQQNQHIIQQKVLVTDPKTGKQTYVMKNVVDPKYAQAQKQYQNPQKQTGLGEAKAAPEKVGNNVKQNPQPQQSNNEEKEKYQKYINGLIKEYTDAKEYFKRNGQEKLANKSREDLRILMHAKQKIDAGRHKEVKLSSLPKPVTYEYIYGYSDSERTEKFKLVLTQLIKDKNEIDQKMKSIFEKLQKLKKRELEKAKVSVKPKLDELKARKEKISKLMDSLKERFRDKWTPAPEYKKVQVEDQIEKITYEGCKYGLNIKVGKTDYDKDKTSLVILLEVNKNKTLQKAVQLKREGDFNEEWKWEFTGDEWKNIPKTFLYIDLYRQHTFSNDKKGSGKIDLTSIRRGTTIKTDCKIEIESKRVEPIVSFVITPVLPEGKKYYEKTTKEVIKIQKIYPPFTGKQPLTDNSNAPSKPQASPAVQKPPAKSNNANNNAQDNNQNQPIIDKSKFKPEELEDVDFIDNLNTLKVLEFKIKELELKIKKIDGRTPREMLQKKVKMNCKKKQLENGMEEGTISPKDYMEFMRVQLEHDQLLAMYMKQTNQEEKMKTVMQRTVLIKQEMEELKKYMK